MGLNVCNFIWRIYVALMLCFEIISFEEFSLLGDVSLMTCCYTLRENLCHWKLLFLLSLNFCKYIQEKQDSKQEFRRCHLQVGF